MNVAKSNGFDGYDSEVKAIYKAQLQKYGVDKSSKCNPAEENHDDDYEGTLKITEHCLADQIEVYHILVYELARSLKDGDQANRRAK